VGVTCAFDELMVSERWRAERDVGPKVRALSLGVGMARDEGSRGNLAASGVKDVLDPTAATRSQKEIGAVGAEEG